MENKFMEKAVEEAIKGVTKGDGGPFGAVVVKDGKIVSYAHNQVVCSNDPTAHAEIQALRAAGKILNRFDLSDCELYTSCEPCPMCYAAIHWARIKTVYYGCTRDDAAAIGFDDRLIYDLIKGETTEDAPDMINYGREEGLKAFALWENKEDKTRY